MDSYSVAGTVLTSHDTENHGVFGTHIWRELISKESPLFFTASNYLTLLSKLRELAKKHDLEVRVIEKAPFKKNLHDE
jgi:hypothetical protein